jgi:predicted RNase H-like HicB family nuclease
MPSRRHFFQVIVERDEAGYYAAECPAFRACYTQGKTYEEVIENIKDVIALCLADPTERRLDLPSLKRQTEGMSILVEIQTG